MTRLTEKDLNQFLCRGHKAQKAVDLISEKQWQQAVKDLARLLGWKTYHTLHSKGSDPDFPDLVMARRKRHLLLMEPRLLVSELKIEGKKPTPGQQWWLDFFKEMGAETYAWVPSDLEWVKRVLK